MAGRAGGAAPAAPGAAGESAAGRCDIATDGGCAAELKWNYKKVRALQKEHTFERITEKTA